MPWQLPWKAAVDLLPDRRVLAPADGRVPQLRNPPVETLTTRNGAADFLKPPRHSPGGAVGLAGVQLPSRATDPCLVVAAPP